ncbi:MAG: PIG-L family deacetylase [Anaerolineae bacterium]|nr:PIG-L family deacetylase [Anaerolineae bacterium]
MHIYLSPHPDDAVFSCGGQIYQRLQKGDEVLIMTLMAGHAPAQLRPNVYIQEHHQRWGLGEDAHSVVEGRRAEDAAAAAVLGANLIFGHTPEALYRTNGDSHESFYQSREALFGPVHSGDASIPHQIAEAFEADIKTPITALYAPLGVGGHVDHLLARDAALILARQRPDLRVYFYEEYPYSREDRRIILAAMHAFGQPLLKVSVSVSPEALQSKIRASRCYHSQISSFWENPDALDIELTTYHAQIGGENLWRLLRGDEFA